MAWFATTAALAAANGIYYGAKYAGSAIAGAVGYGLMNNTVTNFTEVGSRIAGPIGGAAGNVLGRGAAGLSVNTAVGYARNISGAVDALADAGFALHQQSATPLAVISNTAGSALAEKKVEALETPQPQVTLVQQPQTTWKQVAWQAAKVAATVGVGVGAVAMGVGVLAPLAVSAANAIPDVASALAEKAADPANVSLVGDVVAPFTTQMAIAGISTLAGGVATYNYIESAHDGRIAMGAKVGGVIDGWMPNGVKGTFTSAGRIAGTIDAGRHAMSDPVVARAIQAGANTQTVVESGLNIANTIVQQQVSNTEAEASGWGETARKAAWVVGGAVAAGGFALIAPEAAAVAGGAALLSVAAPFARYAKAKVMGGNAPAAEAETKNEEAATVEPQDAAEKVAEPVELKDSLTASKIADSLSVKEAIFADQAATSSALSNSFVMLPTAAPAA